MLGCVPCAIGKVFHEVLLKISQVFLVKPRILQTESFLSVLSSILKSTILDIFAACILPMHPCAPAEVPVFSTAAGSTTLGTLLTLLLG